jgi:hypothetical protein
MHLTLLKYNVNAPYATIISPTATPPSPKKKKIKFKLKTLMEIRLIPFFTNVKEILCFQTFSVIAQNMHNKTMNSISGEIEYLQ